LKPWKSQARHASERARPERLPLDSNPDVRTSEASAGPEDERSESSDESTPLFTSSGFLGRHWRPAGTAPRKNLGKNDLGARIYDPRAE